MKNNIKQELEQKLNEEYKNIGNISIEGLSKDVIDISKIEYIHSIMEKIPPLDVDDEIVVTENYNGNYKIIDGYHRMKSKLIKGEKNINVYILKNYCITRKNDTFFSFMESLTGKNIKFVEDNLIVIGNKYYQIKENEGCGGCDNGWSSIRVLPKFIGKEIKIKIISIGNSNSDEYDLIINGEKIAEVDTGWGNGYYGGDFKINLIH